MDSAINPSCAMGSAINRGPTVRMPDPNAAGEMHPGLARRGLAY
ncbi:MAG TPA: hypothetical protein VGC09_03175 [Rhodopila sp.]